MNVTAQLIQISNALDKISIRPRPKKKRTYKDYVEDTRSKGGRPLKKDVWESRARRTPSHNFMEDEDDTP